MLIIMKKNLTSSSKYFIHIENINSKGEGVGRIDNWVVFVPYAVPGDYLEIEILSSQKKHSTGKILNIISPSDNRVTPLCPYFTLCGGCSLQTIKYSYQLYFKKELLKENLKKIGSINPEIVQDMIPSSQKWYYRNKVQHILSKTKKGVLKTGFFQRHSHKVVNITECLIQHELSNKLIHEISHLLSHTDWSIYNEKFHSGLLRYIITKTSFSRKEIIFTLITTEENLPGKAKFIRSLENFSGLKGIVQNINPRRTNTIMGSENLLLWGRDYIIEDILGLKFKISPSSFFQTNVTQLEQMVNIIMDFVRPLKINFILDAYCGIGTFALFLSRLAQEIWGIEENSEAIRMAEENTVLNKLYNLNFIRGKVEDLIYRAGEKRSFDLIILDPPRKGCERNILQAIKKLKIKHIIYISCNPSTLARDLAFIVELGYIIKKIKPVDMFPHTSHIETICHMQMKEGLLYEEKISYTI